MDSCQKVPSYKMGIPQDLALPFHAYGIFKSGEISFHCIKECIQTVKDDVALPFRLYIRDGIPLVDANDRSDTTVGCLIQFNSGSEKEAYERIASLEPEKYYFWSMTEVDGQKVNFLAGKSPQKGSVLAESNDWDSWGDPLFTEVFDIVARASEVNTVDITGRAFIELQMLYLLIWTSVERFASLRYGFRGDSVIAKLHKLANSLEFSNALNDTFCGVTNKKIRKVYSSDSVEKVYKWNPKKPVETIDFYYQVRCNIAHRGKAAISDANLVKDCIKEMTDIFKHLLKYSKLTATAATP